MHKLLVVVVAALLAALFTPVTSAQSPMNLSIRSTLPLPACTTADVWAIGERYVLIARRNAGFSILDAADPANPIRHDVIPPGYPVRSTSYGVGDIKSDGRYIYATDEGTGRGVFIYDTAASVTNPTLVGDLPDWRLSAGTHNCWVEGNWLYCVSNGTRRIEIYDVSVKTAPVWVATLGNGIASAAAHDVIVLDDRAYCSLLNGGFAIYDVSNPAAPVLLGSQGYANAFTHNAWPSEDRRYLYTTDENVVSGIGGSVRIWDISNLNAITQVGNYKVGQPDSVVHNTIVRGEYLFTSYYKEGVRVASLRNDPTNPVEIAHFDTFPGNGVGCFGQINGWGSSYAGCWGVFPFGSSHLLVSDLDSGAYLLNLHPVGHSFSAQSNSVPAGGAIRLTLDYRNDTPVALAALGAIVLTKINGQATMVPMLIDAKALNASQSSGPQILTLPLPLGLPAMNVEFTAYAALLEPTFLSGETTLPITIF